MRISTILLLVAFSGVSVAQAAIAQTPGVVATKKKATRTKSILELADKIPNLREQLRGMFGNHYSAVTLADKEELETFSRVRKADELLRIGNTSGAQSVYQDVLSHYKGQAVSAGAVAGLAEIARRNGEDQKATDLYQYLVKDDPSRNWTTSYATSPEIHLKLALLLRNSGHTDEAWEHFQFAMRQQPGRWWNSFPSVTKDAVGTAQFALVANLSIADQLQDFDSLQAISFAQAAVLASPTNGLPHYYLGKLLRKSKPDEAQVELAKAVSYGHGDYVKQAEIYLRGLQSANGNKPVAPAPEK